MANNTGSPYHLIIYSDKEEAANRLTSGLGALLSLIGLVVLLHRASLNGDPWRILSCSIYGGSLVIFYLLATIYHSVRTPKVRYVFRILDHATIFLVIAGTYTPYTLVTLRGPWGWSLFGVVWSLAIAGAIFKTFMVSRLRVLMPVLYIVMGWLMVIAIKPLMASLPLAGVVWLVAGGLFYTFGIIFYAIDKIPQNHAIWHIFVLAGSACHYFSVLWYVVPGNST